MSQPDPGSDDARAAGIVSRGVAAVTDLAVVLILMGVLYLGVVLTRLVFSPTAFSMPELNAVFSTLSTFAVATLYLTVCWSVSGCTAGAVTMGLRVVGRRSARMSPMVALLRAIACVLFPVGLLWVAVDRRRQSLQDVVFRTRVVYWRAD